MSSVSPTAEGFRLIFRRPLIPLAEIAWRWSFGLATCALVILFLIEYANSLPVDAVDRFLLRSGQGPLIVRALQRIFHGSGLRFTEAAILLAVVLTIGWIVLASMGRAATLKAIVAEVGTIRIANPERFVVPALFGLNMLRAGAGLAAIVAGIGAALISNAVWASTHVSAMVASGLWFVLLFVIWISWVVLNWFFSSSALFVVTNGARSLAAVSDTVHWLRNRPAAFTNAGIWFGLAHAGAIIMAAGAEFTVLGVAGGLGAGPAIFLEILIVAGYCAVADLIYIGRLSAYAAIICGEQAFESVRLAGYDPRSTLGRSAIDQNESILSDVPIPVT